MYNNCGGAVVPLALHEQLGLQYLVCVYVFSLYKQQSALCNSATNILLKCL